MTHTRYTFVKINPPADVVGNPVDGLLPSIAPQRADACDLPDPRGSQAAHPPRDKGREVDALLVTADVDCQYTTPTGTS